MLIGHIVHESLKSCLQIFPSHLAHILPHVRPEVSGILKLSLLAHPRASTDRTQATKSLEGVLFPCPFGKVKTGKSCPRWMKATSGVLEKTLPFQNAWLLAKVHQGIKPQENGSPHFYCVCCVCNGSALLCETVFTVDTYLCLKHFVSGSSSYGRGAASGQDFCPTDVFSARSIVCCHIEIVCFLRQSFEFIKSHSGRFQMTLVINNMVRS